MDLSTPATPPTDDESQGLVFSFGFAADGTPTADPGAAHWSWKSYALTDARARRAIETHPALPPQVRATLLAGSGGCHVDFDDGWLHGELPDVTHEHYSDAREVGHFRFALADTMLVSGRRQPLKSIEAVRGAIDKGRRFRSPVDLLEAAINLSLDHLATETTGLAGRLDSIEDGIVGERWHGERESLTAARREAVAVHRHVTTVTHLFRHLDQAHAEDLPEPLADMAARITGRAIALHHDCEQIQARARLLQDELLAKLTSESNRLLYFLSVLTAVLMPMTIISGLFGMNVGSIPFAEGSGGFWIVSVIAAAVALGVLAVVKRLGGRR